MSSELIFRKGKAELFSYVGSSKMYEALHGYAIYDKWSPVTDNALKWGEETLREKKEYFSSQINKNKEALKYLKTAEEIYDALNYIEELEDELKETDTALTELRLINIIQSYLQYDKNGKKLKIPLEWMVG